MILDNDYFESQKQKQRISWLKSVGFYKRIDSFYELVERLSQKNFEHIKFLNTKKRIICTSIGMDASLYSLKGIKSLCEIGDIVDSFTLLRKIRDNLYLDLFFISESLNNKPKNYELSKSFSDMTQEEMIEEIIKYVSAALEEEEKNKNIQSISNWFDDKYSSQQAKESKVAYFSFAAFKKNIEGKSNIIKECHELYLNKIFRELNNGLNNYVHSNGPSFASNDKINMSKDLFIKTISDLLIFLDMVKRVFLIDLYFIDSTVFQTDDYVDALDMGLTPIDGSQYNAICQIVEEFEEIDKDDHELYNYLKNNNPLSMRCFYDDN